MPNRETREVNKIMLCLSGPQAVVFRNNVGAAKTSTGGFVRFGVGGPGGSDIIGIKSVRIAEDDVGKVMGLFYAVEVKTLNGSLTEKQRKFLRMVEQKGGVAEVYRSGVLDEKWRD